MTKYRKHTKIAEQEQEQEQQEQQFSNFLDRSRYSHGQKDKKNRESLFTFWPNSADVTSI